jgi:hypothetical protein
MFYADAKGTNNLFFTAAAFLRLPNRQPAIHTYIIIVLICVLISGSFLVLCPFTTYLLVEQIKLPRSIIAIFSCIFRNLMYVTPQAIYFTRHRPSSPLRPKFLFLFEHHCWNAVRSDDSVYFTEPRPGTTPRFGEQWITPNQPITRRTTCHSSSDTFLS